jgi:hypothetical protein
MSDEGEFLDKLKAAIRRFPTVTQITIDEYQLGFATSEVRFTSETSWELTVPGGRSERLNADFRQRASEAYAICRIIGRDIVSVEMDESENFIVGFDSGDRLVLAKRQDGFESYNIGGAGVGLWVF